MKVRPLFILSDLKAGGAQRVMLTVIRHLDRKIFGPELAIIKPDGPLKSEIAGDIPVHDLKCGRVRYSLPSIFRLCRRHRPNIVIATLSHINIYLLIFKFLLPSQTKLIIREANTASIRLLSTKNPALYRFLYRIFYPRADRIICNSRYMENDLIKYFGLSPLKTVVIHNPVDVERIRDLSRGTRSPYNSGKVHLVTVGRLIYQKGFDVLIRCISKLARSVSSFDLTIVGDGPEKLALKNMVGEFGIADRVKFVGHQDNPFIFMAYADLFVSSSRWEGLPNAVLESLSCGTPVLAFDCPGGTGEIIQHGVNGWLVPNGDLEGMSEMIAAFIKDKKWLEFQYRELLPEKFKSENVLSRYEQLMLEVCKKRHVYIEA